tara:strand:+ start:286 stop:1152 length:867 start_codon:yes stop_codon:yes gene_type:complete
MKYFNYLLQAIIIYMSFLLIKTLGINISRKIFIRIFRVIGPIVRTNKIVVSNINRISETIDEGEREKIIDEMWSNYAITFVEYVYLKKFSSQQNHIQIKNKEILEKISNSKKPVIFISGHFSNFELMAMEIYKSKVKLSAIYRPLNNIFLNPFMEMLRKKFICPNQIKKGVKGLKDAINHLRNGHSLALMIDQRLSEGEKIKFFGNDAKTTTLPAQLALKFKLLIVPIYLKRKENFNYELEVFQPLNFEELENNDDNKTKITQELNNWLEKVVKKNPGQWILTHNRWK